MNLNLQNSFLDRRKPGPIKSVLLAIIGWFGWLVGWLVCNAVFSETALRIFLIFCMKLGDYKGRKVTEPNFWKNLIWRYSQKGLQISPKSDTLIFFSKTAVTVFLVFGLKLVLNMTFNSNETYFSEKFVIWIYLTPKPYAGHTQTFSRSLKNVHLQIASRFLWSDFPRYS